MEVFLFKGIKHHKISKRMQLTQNVMRDHIVPTSLLTQYEAPKQQSASRMSSSLPVNGGSIYGDSPPAQPADWNAERGGGGGGRGGWVDAQEKEGRGFEEEPKKRRAGGAGGGPCDGGG